MYLIQTTGRLDLIQLIFQRDREKSVSEFLNSNPEQQSVESPAYLALINSFQPCAAWQVILIIVLSLIRLV